MGHENPVKWKHFCKEIILLCVCWYLRYALSYRDLEEIMQERDVKVSHTTIYRWVIRCGPEVDRRSRLLFEERVNLFQIIRWDSICWTLQGIRVWKMGEERGHETLRWPPFIAE